MAAVRVSICFVVSDIVAFVFHLFVSLMSAAPVVVSLAGTGSTDMGHEYTLIVYINCISLFCNSAYKTRYIVRDSTRNCPFLARMYPTYLIN